jgi:hypothetical protein
MQRQRLCPTHQYQAWVVRHLAWRLQLLAAKGIKAWVVRHLAWRLQLLAAKRFKAWVVRQLAWRLQLLAVKGVKGLLYSLACLTLIPRDLAKKLTGLLWLTYTCGTFSLRQACTCDTFC